MGLSKEERPSRWQPFPEARDCLRKVLAPALPLRHLPEHGARIAGRTRFARPRRPAQMIPLPELISKA